VTPVAGGLLGGNAYPAPSSRLGQQMGFFNKVGRTVEQFSRTAKDVADDQAGYRCRSCEERFHTDHDACPECGAETVEAVEAEN
jgi:hypothetical protein